MNAGTASSNRTLNRPLSSLTINAGTLIVLLLIAGQNPAVGFENLDFESPTFVSVGSGFVEADLALPGWSVFLGTDLADSVFHDSMWLDSACVSILDTNSSLYPYPWLVLPATFEGDYTVLLQAGFINGPYDTTSAAIAQTGTIPTWAKTLLFDASLQTVRGDNFVVTIGGAKQQFYAVAAYTNYVLCGLDVSRFAGQSQEIRFTMTPYQDAPPVNGIYLDDIRFSGEPMQSRFSYSITNGMVTITGFSGPTGALDIPGTIDGSPVTSIGDRAFVLCPGITSVTIPNTVTNIGTSAFRNCYNLTSITIPNSITSIGPSVFQYCTSLHNIVIPSTITNIGDAAFYGCTSLTIILFMGNAPTLGSSVFTGSSSIVYIPATVYYMPGTAGWGWSFGGLPTAQWTQVPIIETAPQTQTAEAGSDIYLWAQATNSMPLFYAWYFNDTNFIRCSTNGELALTNVQFSQAGVYAVVISNALGAVTSSPAMLNVIAPVERRPVPAVNLMALPGSSLGVDYCDALGSMADWENMATMTLSNNSQFYFDLTAPLPSQRFYRVRQMGTPNVVPSLNLNFVPAITLTGNIGHSLRLDYINAIGPTDAWVTLDTVTLTNASQLYFDTSSIGQPRRLYRIVPGL